MGMTDEMFWHSTPAQFTLRVEAYKRHNRADAMYFRETFALLYNINRNEKAPVLEGKDVLTIHGDKPPKKERRQKSMMDDPVAMADFMERLNAMSRREVEESALFDLQTHEYLRRRAYGQITTEMVEYCIRKKYFEENPNASPESFVMPIISNPRALDDNAPMPIARLARLKTQIEAELKTGVEAIPASVTSIEQAPLVPVPMIESEPKLEPETRADVNQFVPPGLSGEAIPIQSTQWD